MEERTFRVLQGGEKDSGKKVSYSSGKKRTRARGRVAKGKKEVRHRFPVEEKSKNHQKLLTLD